MLLLDGRDEAEAPVRMGLTPGDEVTKPTDHLAAKSYLLVFRFC
jgi:hypothetical protein